LRRNLQEHEDRVIMKPSRIDCEIDLEADGKHFGFARIPHSVHRSAYGWLSMPIASIRNGDGPRLLLMSGNHGDEYEGQVALTRLLKWLEPSAMQGTVVVLPMANYPAALAGTRTSPIDAGNLNRTFPGDADGTPTEMIAHFIEEVLMPSCDVLVDLHSGGSSLNYIPSVQAELDEQGVLPARTRELVEAFGAPVTQVYRPPGEDRRSEDAARRKGLVYFTTELGGIGTVSREGLKVTEHGIARTLLAAGSIASLPEGVPSEAPTRYAEIRGEEHFVWARDVGLFEPLVSLGDEVVAGQPAAAVHFPETPWREPVVMPFIGDGLVVCQRIPGRVERGDCLFHLASDWPAPL
jgi:predicted deacylase